MQKTNYPEFRPRRAQRQPFIKRVAQFQRELKAGDAHQSIAVMDFIKDSLTQHIKQTDRQYSAHMNANGVS